MDGLDADDSPTDRRRTAALATGLACLVSLFALAWPHGAAAAAVQPEAPEARVVLDATGRSVLVPTHPKRIVTAGPATLMVADALYLFPGAPARIAGIGRIDQGRGNFLEALDPDYRRYAVLETNAGPEQIAALEPDLVILKSTNRERIGDGVERLGIPVVYVDFETPEHYQRDLILLGELLADRPRAREVAYYFAWVEEETAAIARKAAAAHGGKPSVLFLYASVTGGQTAFQVPPRGWIQTTMVELASGEPVWIDEAPVAGWRTVTLEQIAVWNPQVITLVAYRRDVEAVRESLLADPAWRELEAVRSGSLHAFPVDYYSWDQPDVRWILGLQWLTSVLWPDEFPPGVLRERVYEFFAIAYAMDRPTTDRLIFAMLGDAWR